MDIHAKCSHEDTLDARLACRAERRAKMLAAAKMPRCSLCGSTEPEDVQGQYSSCCNDLIIR